MAKPTAQAYAELQKAYDHFNLELFEGTLPDCLLTLQREKDTYGYFSRNRFISSAGEKIDEIALNPSYFAVQPLVEILQTIAHEMVHLWQAHFGKPGRVRYHNGEFAAKMEAIGLMPSSTGQPGGRRTGDRVADYAIAGGRFLQACETLVTEDFRISWLDRFPSPRQVLSASTLSSLDLPASVGGGAPPMQELVATSLRAQDEAGQAVLVTQPREQTRARYVCPCGVKVWGKPNIKIWCGNCNGSFEVGT
jgi:predicted SprT family Zn-dependent metalloprotease